jgi:hypothetical protein
MEVAMAESSRKITVWTESVEEQRKAALPSLGRTVTQFVDVDAEVLATNLREFIESFVPAISALPPKTAGYALEEMEFSLAVDGKGGIQLLGQLSIGAQASIKLKLKRRDA